jgi:hypothetical protein
VYTENTRNAQKFEYLGEFKAKIKSTLGGQSGTQVASFFCSQTRLKQKLQASVPLILNRAAI